VPRFASACSSAARPRVRTRPGARARTLVHVLPPPADARLGAAAEAFLTAFAGGPAGGGAAAYVLPPRALGQRLRPASGTPASPTPDGVAALLLPTLADALSVGALDVPAPCGLAYPGSRGGPRIVVSM
jgi:hypothetical protein